MNEQVAAAYRRCRELHRRHGRSYYLATRLLPVASRWHVHALYGFTRTADDLVDTHGLHEPAAALAHLGERLHAGLADPAAVATDPILPAVVRTVHELRLNVGDLDRFLASMAMDLTITSYETYDDLLVYMDGSAAVIGTMLLPVLAPADSGAAREPARQLGLAFQLTNFIRDIAEDLDRGRVYLPQEDLRQCGVRVEDLQAATTGRGLRAAGPATPNIHTLIGYAMSRARHHYAAAEPGIDLLPPASARCVRVAHRVYAAILDEVEARGRDVFAGRTVVPPARRVRLALTALLSDHRVSAF